MVYKIVPLDTEANVSDRIEKEINTQIENTMSRLLRTLYNVAGWHCLSLGFIGIFVPILPTTPFVLLAAFCFSRGSNNLHEWLLKQKTFGPLIHDWHHHGIIRRHVKWTATGLIVILLGYSVFFAPSTILVKIALAFIAVGVIGFICSRPSSI